MRRIELILFLLFLALTTTHVRAQDTNFDFNTKFYNALDKWVVFPMNRDSTYIYGFIYFDTAAGFTFNIESKFKMVDGKPLRIPDENEGSRTLKYRMGANTKSIAILDDQMLTDLQLPEQPEWLNIYKSEDPDYMLLRLGFTLNAIGACQEALEPLVKVYNTDPHYKGVEIELAYAYNHLKQYGKALEILDKAIPNDPGNSILYRELGYAYVRTNQMEAAEKAYTKGIEVSKNNSEKGEMAINMAQVYFLSRDKANFDKWAEITLQYSAPGSQFHKLIQLFNDNWDKQ